MPVSLSLGVLCEAHGQPLVVELSLFCSDEGRGPGAQPWISCSHIHPFHPHSLTHSFVQSPCWLGVGKGHSSDLFLTCLVALHRLFVLGIGFFSLCFLMTSLGGQFSARRPGDSPLHHPHRRYLGGERGVRSGCRCLWVEEKEASEPSDSRNSLGLCPRDPGHLINGCVNGEGPWLRLCDLEWCFAFGPGYDHQATSGQLSVQGRALSQGFPGIRRRCLSGFFLCVCVGVSVSEYLSL